MMRVLVKQPKKRISKNFLVFYGSMAAVISRVLLNNSTLLCVNDQRKVCDRLTRVYIIIRSTFLQLWRIAGLALKWMKEHAEELGIRGSTICWR